MLNVVDKKTIWFTLSGLLVLVSLGLLAASGLKLGLDFKGGSIAEIRFAAPPPEAGALQKVVDEMQLGAAPVQPTNSGTFVIRTRELSPEQHQELLKKFSDSLGELREERYESIGPTISAEVTRRAFYQLILVSLAILAYIAWAFRRVPKPLSSWRFGWAAVIALIHDLLIVMGVFAMLGKTRGVEVDALFVTALLTVLGFSVHDTIIVFDRIRENLRRLSGQTFANIVSRSINQTIVRSINTSTTVIFVLIALLLFGGESTRYFVLALLIGIVVGTYSSIFIASPLLYVFHRKKLN